MLWASIAVLGFINHQEHKSCSHFFHFRETVCQCDFCGMGNYSWQCEADKSIPLLGIKKRNQVYDSPHKWKISLISEWIWTWRLMNWLFSGSNKNHYWAMKNALNFPHEKVLMWGKINIGRGEYSFIKSLSNVKRNNN